MTTTIIRPDVYVDFDLIMSEDLACERKRHNGADPAEWIFRADCPKCGTHIRQLICSPCKHKIENTDLFSHHKCGVNGLTPDDLQIRFVRV